MKKFCVLLLIITMLFVSTAFAEQKTISSFTLRNGISFNDTIVDIKNKEKLSITAEGDGWIQYEGTIANEQGGLLYSFSNTDGKLTDVLYVFQNVASRINTYENLYNGIVKKYGEPLALAVGEIYPITGMAFTYSLDFVDAWKALPGYADIVKYNEWAVPVDNGLIKIEIVEDLYVNKAGEEILNAIFLSYRFADSALVKYMEEIQDISDDL